MIFGKKAFTIFIPLLFFAQVVLSQTDSSLVISNIRLVGNNKTKEYVIHRELSFKVGDTLSTSEINNELEFSRNNLLNTSLFNYVTIEHFKVDEVFTEVLIVVTERWYILPAPILDVADPNFNTWWETKDFRRLNWGTAVLNNNFRGRNEQLGMLFQFGYSKRFALMYDVPYTEKHQNVGFGAYSSYEQRYEVVYGTENNKRLFTRPSGRSREEWFNAVYVKLRNEIYNSHQFSLLYRDAQVQDSIVINNPDYFSNGASRFQFFEVNYIFKNDHRDYKAYPLNGYFLRLDINHVGLGIVSPVSLTSSTLEAKNFVKLSDRFYWAVGAKGKVVLQDSQPYFLQRSLGYDDFVRGYEYYVIDGRHFGLFKTNFKMKLVDSGKKKIPGVNNPRYSSFHYAFYLNLFTDAGYVSDSEYFNNLLANDWMIGYGIGLDLVTFYDKVFRVEFARNRLNESGFFIHFVQPI